MAVPDHVSTFVKAGMNEVWKSCYNTRRIKYKSFKYDIFSRNDINVLFKFVMSLIVTITFASITATILYFFDSDSVSTIQDRRFLVTELHVTSKTETSVRLEWTKPVLIATRYEVHISSEMSDLAVDVDAWTESSIDIDMLTSGVFYSFSVTSFVTSDDKQEIPRTSAIISILTKPSPPGPIDMHNSHVFQAHVELSWGASHGYLDSYHVVLKNCMGNVVTETTTESTHLTLPLGNPSTFTAYVVEIYALSGVERSDAQTQVIQMEESDLCIQDLHVTTQDTMSATLEWRHPAYTPVENYEVRWSPARSDQHDVLTVDPDWTWVSVDDLMPGQLYKFSVTSVFPTQCGEEKRVQSHDISVTTRPAVPGMVDWIKSTVKSTSLNLHWKASEGMVDAYIVEIADGSSFQAEYPTDGPSVLIENLEINTLYKVDIYAVSGNMMSERRTEEMKTKDIQGPAVPGMVDWIKSTVKSTSLNLHWKASEGMVDAYIVEIADGSSFREEYRTDGPSVLIENLEINTLYKVDIYAVSGNMMSERRTEEMKTKDIQVYWGCMTKAILTGGIAVAGLASFAPFLGVFGFGAAGVGKGTLAASWMSSYGGTIASGGVFSTLQSLGVVGLGATAKAAIIASGMALGCITEVA
ncbi:tenascin-X-like [Mizuhopecten yessoensis]|uniref:tenascin-X-like n=1 Tax=Mizuhopecten yessoensis TaxID=6573 RepID=UPI000B45B2A3|nr:tenascin-X-like [Mizuhopecten yessoensis]